MTDASALHLSQVSYSYAEAAAVRDVTLTIGGGEGSLVALTGPNGSGKSTLLKLMARVLAPDRGEIRFEGRPLRQWPAKEYARSVGYLPQEPEPAFPMRAIEVVLSGRAPFLGRFSWESAADHEVAAEALARCDAAHLADRFLDEMSGGERKRVFLARVLAGNPRLILLDEPLAALDVSHVQQVASLLRSITAERGITAVFASHDLNWAAAYSDRMIVMQNGAVALDAAPREVMNAETMRRFFAFDARTVDAGGRVWVVPDVIQR